MDVTQVSASGPAESGVGIALKVAVGYVPDNNAIAAFVPRSKFEIQGVDACLRTQTECADPSDRTERTETAIYMTLDKAQAQQAPVRRVAHDILNAPKSYSTPSSSYVTLLICCDTCPS